MVFGKRRKTRGYDPARPLGSPGKRLYAVGDIHGRFDLLQTMLERIFEHNRALPAADTHIVFLGDLIDRGPHSKQVVQHLQKPPPATVSFWFIKGNHEEALVRGLTGDPSLLSPWLSHGGYDTAESYGLDRGTLIGQPDSVLEHLLLSAIPRKDIEFMAGFQNSVRLGDYLLVHAGIRPGVPIERQSDRDLRWIRGEFLTSKENFGCVVVHGHTVEGGVTEASNRIGLDTGAYRTGVLSALWVEGPERGILQVTGAPDLSFESPGA
jgi:serine/threonine protein phosphatase 1